MDRALFDAVRQKSLAQWSHRTVVRSKSDHLLAGLLFDDAGIVWSQPTPRKLASAYRYYVSTLFRFESRTTSLSSYTTIPATSLRRAAIP